MDTSNTLPAKPDRRRNALYLIIGGCLFTGLITGQSMFFNLAYVFIGLMLTSLLWAWTTTRWLHLSRHTIPRRAQVGHYVEERFELGNASLLPKLWLEFYDESLLPGHRASHVVSGLRRAAAWSVRTLCVQRGVFRLGPVRLVTGDPFGLYEARRQIHEASSLTVLPATVDLPAFTLPEGLLSGGDALRGRAHQITPNATSVREYFPGDSLNRIHWRSTARRARLMVKEFELDPQGDVWIMLDADRRTQAGAFSPTAFLEQIERSADPPAFHIPASTEEYSVTIAASLAQHFLNRKRNVGFAAYGQHREIIPADRGERQLLKILESLAILRARGALSFEQMLVQESAPLTRGTTLIIITPSVRQAWVLEAARLVQRGLKVTGVVIDAESFGGRQGASQMVSLLASSAIAWRKVRRGDDIALALSAAGTQFD